MSRLPTPGGDSNTWGIILNDFLSVEHNSDGTLKSSGSLAAKADDSSVVHNAGAEAIAGTKTFSASPVVPDPSASNQAASKNYVDTVAATKSPASHTHTLTTALTAYSKQGALSVATGAMRLPIEGTYTIVGTRLMVGTAPTGASLIVDVNKNGSTIYTTQANRPTIAASSNSGGPGSTPDVTSLAAGDYLTVDIDQVGSTVAGSDLTVTIVVTKTV